MSSIDPASIYALENAAHIFEYDLDPNQGFKTLSNPNIQQYYIGKLTRFCNSEWYQYFKEVHLESLPDANIIDAKVYFLTYSGAALCGTIKDSDINGN